MNEVTEQQQAFQTGQFLGTALVYILFGMVIFMVVKRVIKKIRKKNDTIKKDQV